MSDDGVAPIVGVVGGSRSDYPTLETAVAILEELEVPAEFRIVSAHRTPDRLFQYAEEAAGRGIKVIVAGAGGAAHLPGMLAAKTLLPVIGVPIPTQHMGGLDSLLSIVQMPRGVPVATDSWRRPSWPCPIRRWPSASPPGAPARPRPSWTTRRTPSRPPRA